MSILVQSLRRTVTASDLNGASVIENASVVVSNTPPEFSVVPLLSPSSGHQVDQNIECSAQASDLDGDSVSLSFSWTVDGQPAGTGGAFLPTESIPMWGKTSFVPSKRLTALVAPLH